MLHLSPVIKFCSWNFTYSNNSGYFFESVIPPQDFYYWDCLCPQHCFFPIWNLYGSSMYDISSLISRSLYSILCKWLGTYFFNIDTKNTSWATIKLVAIQADRNFFHLLLQQLHLFCCFVNQFRSNYHLIFVVQPTRRWYARSSIERSKSDIPIVD